MPERGWLPHNGETPLRDCLSAGIAGTERTEQRAERGHRARRSRNRIAITAGWVRGTRSAAWSGIWDELLAIARHR